MIKSELDYYKDHVKVLEGGTILTSSAVDEDGMLIPYLIVELPDGTVYQVDILMDPEGNDGGHLDIIKRN